MELERCPFCGGESQTAKSKDQIFTDEGYKTNFIVRCKDIECIGSSINTWEMTEEQASSKWNNRANGWIPVSMQEEPEKDV